jgi:hypothetical protein
MDKYYSSFEHNYDAHVKDYYQYWININRAIEEYQALEYQSWW